MCQEEETGGEEHSGFEAVRSLVECQICFHQVVHDRLELERHMEKTHFGFSLRQYFEFFVFWETSTKLLGNKRPKLELTRCKKETPANRKIVQKVGDQDVSEAEILLRQAPRSDEVVNRCAFKCPHCKARFGSWPAIYKHNQAKKYGGCSGINGGYTKWEEVAVEVTTHECQVCGHLLPCDKDKVACHLTRHHHGLRAHEYRVFIEEKKCHKGKMDLKAFLKDFRKKEKEEKEQQKKNQQDVPVVSMNKISKDNSLTPYQNLVEKDSVTMKVGNMCCFACKKCPFETDTMDKMIFHWKKKCTTEKDPSRDQSCVKVARVHMCHLCAEKVLCDRHIITRHVRHIHQMAISSYISLTEKNLGSMSEEALKELVERRVQEPDERDKQESTNQHVLRSVVPVIRPSSQNFVVMAASSLPRDKTTLLFENLCIFFCPECSSDFDEYKEFHLHVAQSRCRPIAGREIDYKLYSHHGANLRLSQVREARYHYCNVCGRCVLCDRSIIEGHFRSCHKLAKGQYFSLVAKNLAKGGGAIFPPPEPKSPDLRTLVKPMAKSAFPSFIGRACDIPEESITDKVANLCLFR